MQIAILVLVLMAVPFSQACSKTLTGSSGTFTSPGYPSNYPDSSDCDTTITAPSGKIIVLAFTTFDVEEASSCGFDYVQIKDGSTTKKYCGTKIPPPFTSKSNSIVVKFFSDGSVPRKGFNATFNAKDAPPPAPPATVNSADCGVPKVAQSRVIAGTNASKGAWPWQVGLHTAYDSFFCGGSLIAPNWVLTAAHCLERTKPNQLKVKVGDLDRQVAEGTEQTLDVEKIIMHPQYHVSSDGSSCAYSQLNNDVGLLKLSTPAVLNDFVKTVCVPSQSQAVAVNTRCFITGWGKIKHPGYAYRYLQQAMLPIVDSAVCQAKVTKNIGSMTITNQMVCAGTDGSKASGCHGDSGGPLVCLDSTSNKYVLHGDVSWGSGNCDTAVTHSVFGRVSEFRSWIDAKLKEN